MVGRFWLVSRSLSPNKTWHYKTESPHRYIQVHCIIGEGRGVAMSIYMYVQYMFIIHCMYIPSQLRREMGSKGGYGGPRGQCLSLSLSLSQMQLARVSLLELLQLPVAERMMFIAQSRLSRQQKRTRKKVRGTN